ncbi:MAG TPA: energy transducer TonB [Mucilaginibacter sp.]|jgi:TonB family protein|nr:energy transducer TonB [Mucilaginibacter sp.]
MKKTLLTLIPLLFLLTAKAQLTDSARNSNDMVFTSVEHIPEFPGGISQFNKFLVKNLRYPAAARENNTEGRVIVTMVVEKDGSLSQVKVVRGIGDGCDDEAVRLVKLSSPWKPGMQNGRAVRVMYAVPVSFTLAN